MKKLKLMSIISSVAVASSMIAGISASALYTDTSFDEERFKDYIRLEEDDYLFSSDDKNYSAMYLIDAGDGICNVNPVEKINDYLLIDTESAEQYDEIVKAVKSINENLIISKSEYEDKISCTIRDLDAFADISVSDIKKINSLIGDKAVNFRYHKGYYDYTPFSYMYITRYEFGKDEASYYPYNLDDLENLRNYIKDNNIDAEIVELASSSRRVEIDVVPNTELTMLEHYRMAVQIAKATNILPEGDCPQSLNGTSAKVIDVADYTNGDSNEDGSLTLADSVAVLQSIGNPDKYGLSAQGAFNGDVDGNAGITGADALVIQQMELGLL